MFLTDQELKSKTKQLKEIYLKNANLEDLLVEAYAVAFEAVFRVTKLTLHPVQILGAIVLHFGDVAEMKTGEGKTLVSVLPAYLNVLTGQQVCIVTFNEYLVNRDSTDNGKIFAFLGVTVGKTLNQMNRQEKMTNYKKEIIYGTNSEFGFDYLRDNMLQIWEEKLQKKHYYVIVDEIDSILIDEGRTPLIISGKPQNRSQLYRKANQFVKTLTSLDFKTDLESKSCFLQRSGVLKANHYFHTNSIFDIENSELFHFISNALHATFLLKKNVDYLVKNGKVVLIDHFTGRVTPDRTLSEGLHQALEAKELCSIQEESSVLATITYQNFFRLFDKIAGMTGTAKTEEEEFIRLFNMHVLPIPTDQPVVRFDDEDLFFYSKKQKYLTLIEHIKSLHQKKQPILVGTSSVQTSEEFSAILKRFGFKFAVLNAKHHQYEAELIANAGKHGKITISTNMAGRGTDIKLDEIAKKAGGLAVLAVERNESRRIDLQLQGRSGRQGEPGCSVFYLSLDDDLFLRFGNSGLKKFFWSAKDEVLKSGLLSKTIAEAQKKIQIANYEQRKNLLEYDNVVCQQMRVVYSQRDFLIATDAIEGYLKTMFIHFFSLKWQHSFSLQPEVSYESLITFFKHLQTETFLPDFFLPDLATDQTFTKQEVINALTNSSLSLCQKVQKFIAQSGMMDFSSWIPQVQGKTDQPDQFLFLEIRNLLLKTIDQLWTSHLDELLHLKSSSFLHGYAQKSPLQSFIERSGKLFLKLKNDIVFQATTKVFKILHHSWRHIQRQRV